MKQVLNLVVSPKEADEEKLLKNAVSSHLEIKESEINFVKIVKRSIDARSRNIKINLTVEIFTEGEFPPIKVFKNTYPDVTNKKTVIIVGAGPAGLFAALRLIELGFKPIIIERGKDVKERRRDLAAINKEHLVNSDSNYCFGEGGAGTYSDGKLYTRSTKKGDVNKILEIFVEHGASETILIEAHPHIGTNKLPDIIVSMRQTIINSGGEVHFNSRVVDFILKNDTFKGVVTNDGKEYLADEVILATGHSSRDIYELLNKKGILIESKPFAMGVRVEHSQDLIDSMQYHCTKDNVLTVREHLPAASYSLVQQVNGRGVYSFCMCPGGIIAPCATSPGEVVTNGWSPSKRNNPFANSGIVVAIETEDLQAYKQYGVFAGLRFQQELEKMAFVAGGQTQTAPAQRMIDFVNNKLSFDIPKTSYQPGVKSAPLHQLLPEHIGKRLQVAFVEFGKKMKGYYTNDAVVVGVESRTSSPIRIPRDKETLEHPQVKGLFPCGEGAGFAGGIISAAIDGQRCAEMIALRVNA